MSALTVQANELTQTAGINEQAAAAAGQGVQATENADLRGVGGVMYRTHGPISGPSNEAIASQATTREDAGRAIQAACLKLATALKTAATAYTGNDSNSATNLDNQMQR